MKKQIIKEQEKDMAFLQQSFLENKQMKLTQLEEYMLLTFIKKDTYP